MSEVAKLIKKRRIELGMTLEDVAKKVGVGRSTVRKWEEGMIKSIKSDKLEALADVLKISPTYVHKEESAPPLLFFLHGRVGVIAWRHELPMINTWNHGRITHRERQKPE